MKHAKKHSSKRVTKSSNNAKHINKAEKAKSQVKLSKKAQSKAKPQKVNTAKAKTKTAKVNTKSREDRVSLFNMIPKKALIFSMLLLLVFGFISATFAAFITSPEADSIVDGGLVSSIRTARAEKDKNTDSLASLGANADIAETNAVTIYFNNTKNWSNIYAYSGSNMNMTSGRLYNPGASHKMTLVSGSIYSVTMDLNSKNQVVFANADMGNWGDFYGNNAAWGQVFDPSKPLCTPDGSSWSNNNTTYYNCSWAAMETKYTVSVVSSDTNKGTVSPASVSAGTSTKPQITASAKSGYKFTNWTSSSGVTVTNTTSATTTVSATAAGTVTANFEPIVYYLKGGFNSWGNTNPLQDSTTVDLVKGTTYEFKINTNDGKWYCNEGTMTRDNCSGWTFTESSSMSNTKITADITGTYTFTWDVSNKKLSVTYPVPATYAVTFDTDGNGTVNPSGSQQVGDTAVNISATANVGYKFKEWVCVGGATVASRTSASTTVTATATGTVTATFEKIVYYVAGVFNNWRDTTDTLPATIHLDKSDTPYEFKILEKDPDVWYTKQNLNVTRDNCTDLLVDTEGGSNNNCKITADISGDYTFTWDASTKLLSVTYPSLITVNVSAGDGGSVIPEGDQMITEPITISATANPGYKFSHWEVSDGVQVQSATSSITTLSATSSGTVQAVFEEFYHTVTVTPAVARGTMKLYQVFDEQESLIGTVQGTTTAQQFNIRDTADLRIELTKPSANYYISYIKINGASIVSDLNKNYPKTTALTRVTADLTVTFNIPSKPLARVVKPSAAAAAPYTVTYYSDGTLKTVDITPTSTSAGTAYYCDYNTNVTITAKNATGYYVSDIMKSSSSGASTYTSVFTDATRPDPGAQMTYTLNRITATTYIKSVQTPNPVAPTLTFSYGEAGSTYKQGGAPISPTYSYSPSYDEDKGVTSVTETFTCTPSTCTLDSSNGTFSSDVPGTYTITYTVTVNVVNGEKVTSTKTATVIVNSAPKYTVTFTAQSRDGVAGYTNNDTLSENLSGGGTFTEGSNTTLVAPATATAQDKTWYFRGFKKVGGDMALGTKDGDNYKISVENITEAKTFYAYYSTAPNSVVPSYKTTIGNGEDFNINITNSTGGSGTYYFTYSFVPYGSSENYQRSNSGNITVSQPAEGRYVFKLRVHSDEVDNTTSMKESYTQLINQQDIYVLHSSEGFSASFEDAQGFLPGSGDGTTPETAYRVGAEHEVSITITPVSGTQGEYYYKFGENDYSTDNHYVVPVATEGVGANSIVLKMYYIDSLGVQSAESELTIYYYIVSDFAIVKGDIQKVYTEGQLSSFEFRAKAGAESDAYTVQFAKSSDGDTYVDCGDPQTFDSELFSTFHVYEYLNEYGAAFFKATFYEGDSVVGDDYAHTYFGTQSKSGAKSIYFKNVSGTDIDTETLRLMACFSDENGNTSWVTMHKLEGKEIFRATVPNGYSSGVRFYLMYNSKYSRDYDASDAFCYAKSDNETLNANLDAGKYMYTMQSISGGEIVPPSEHWSVYSNI